MATSRVLLVAAILAFVLFVGSAQAGDDYKKCKWGYKSCKSKDGCETSVKDDVHNCGDCGKKCVTYGGKSVKCEDGKCKYEGKVDSTYCKSGWDKCGGKDCKDLSKDKYNCGKCGHKCEYTWKGGEAYCSGSKCYQKCKSGWKYDDKKKYCVYGHY